ncbi:GNAT family N-acetyltransferase [Enterovibrio makurazakiensis]|uniref:GNAT family N-acetyltransferase n=1 Tax=Enterovibrio makurazakiensis TaxID=2910232 RepID=UPI003D24605B
MDIRLRKALNSDISFLMSLRKLTMQQYLEAVGMPTSDEAHLTRINYKFDCAEIITVSDIPVGLFKAEFIEDQNQWYLVQLQVHPDYQNRGIGYTVLERLLSCASESASRIRLSVLKTNPARDLYIRLGFEVVEQSDCEYIMENNSLLKNIAESKVKNTA